MGRYLKLFLGIILSAFGIALVVQADLGAFPKTCLNIGLANCTGFSLGFASFLVEALILIFNFSFKEKIGMGTLLNAFLSGYILDFYLTYLPIAANIVTGIIMIVIGMIIQSLGYYLITDCALGNTATNGFMMIIHKKTNTSILTIRTIEETVFAVVGFIMGGPIGFATVLLSITFGSVMSFTYKLVKFNPDNVKHQFISLSMIRGVLNGRVCNNIYHRKGGKR